MDAGKLQTLINSIYPNIIDWVQIIDENDKSTWTIFYKESATEEQKVAIQTFINNYTPATDLYNDIYIAITNKTENLIETGVWTYTNGAKSLLLHIDRINQNNFMALNIRAMMGTLPFPYAIWDGNNSMEITDAAELSSFSVQFSNHIEGIRVAGKTLRDSIQQQTGETSDEWYIRLNAFVDPR